MLSHYDLGPLVAAESGGGTANANLKITTATGDYFLKRRNPTGVRVFLQRAQTRESRSRTPFRRSLDCYSGGRDSKYGLESFVAFDHALMAHMACHGVKTPRPVPARDGRGWVRINDDVYEVFHYQPGGPHDRHSLPQIASAGRALADYHRAARDFDPPPGKEWPRYDDPRLIREGIAAIEAELKAALGADNFDYLMAQVALLESELPDERYHSLPKLVIHGDYHPGNMKFIGDGVAGIFDLDWATVQPRARDLADGIFLYAGEREGDIDAADIFSLTQTWRPSIERGRVFMTAYLSRFLDYGTTTDRSTRIERTSSERVWHRYAVLRKGAFGALRHQRPSANAKHSMGAETLVEEEADALPLFVRARWLYCRVAGMTKVTPERRIGYFVTGLLEPLRALDGTELLF